MSTQHSKVVKVEIEYEEIDHLVMAEYPYPIAVNYRKMLEAEDWKQRTPRIIEVFDFGIRAMALGVLSQYLLRDFTLVKDRELDKKLQRKLREASLGDWMEFFFMGLKAYLGKRTLFFMPELYDIYVDTSHETHKIRGEIRAPFVELVKLRNDLAHRFHPEDERYWEITGRKALVELRKIMGSFSFLQNYDLIRVKNATREECEYERYTGQQVVPFQAEIENCELREGWFYLYREDHKLLPLHPLMIFWVNENETEWIIGDEIDVAVYSRLLKKTVEYMATVVRQQVEKNDLKLMEQMQGLMEMLQYARWPRETKALSWETFREAIEQLSKQEMEAMRSKYNPMLYLKRIEILGIFNDYLESDKSCFVLTGKSGVGKTNFVLSLVDEYAERQDVGILIYDGSRLEFSGAVGEKIAQDLMKLLEVNEKELFEEINTKVYKQGKCLILVFDSINENAKARQLLQKIDQLIGNQKYDWLKVVIVSRPEAWKEMKRGLPLAEGKYYRRKEAEGFEIELSEFAIKMEPFGKEELEQAYENYQKVYGLLTGYRELKPVIRSLLRDPLVLRLVAEIYRDRRDIIPETLKAVEVYELYIQAMIGSGRLYKEDLAFLERELMPLLLNEGHYDNKILSSQVQTAKTTDGRPLWELISNSDRLSNGESVNASFIRLKETEVLIEQETGIDSTISFQYERFYEYFGGRRLYQAANLVQNRLDFYLDVSRYLSERVYLWGALIHAFTTELLDMDADLVINLVSESKRNLLLRSAMVESITRFGDFQPIKAKDCVLKICGQMTPIPKNFLVGLYRLIRPSQDTPLEEQPRKIIAIEAAVRLKMTEVLVSAAADPSPWLRNIASQNTFYLWQQDAEAGFQVLEGLEDRIRSNYQLPDLGVAESMLSIIGAILGKEHMDPVILERILMIGRRALRRVLFLSNLDMQVRLKTRVRMAFLKLIYNFIVGTILRFVLRVIRDWPEYTWLTMDGLKHVFLLSKEQKDLLNTLIPYLDMDNTGFDTRVQDIITVENWGDQIGMAIVEMSFLGQGYRDYDRTLRLVRQVTEYGLSFNPPKFWTGGPQYNLWMSAIRLINENINPNPDPELLNLIARFIMSIQEDPASWVHLAKTEPPVPMSVTRASYLGAYIGVCNTYKKGQEIPALIEGYIQQAIEKKDDAYLVFFVRQELRVIFEMGFVRPAVLSLKQLVNYHSDVVQKAIIDFLVVVRNYDKDYIDDLLLKGEFPDEIATAVIAFPTSERLIDLLAYQLSNIIYDLFILGPKPLRMELLWVLHQMLHLTNVNNWITLVIREIINLIIGEDVFRVPSDAPSNQLLPLKVSSQ